MVTYRLPASFYLLTESDAQLIPLQTETNVVFFFSRDKGTADSLL